MPGKISNGVPDGAVGPTRKKKVSKRQRTKKGGLRSYVKAVAKYLVSDTYMYAPLVEEAVDTGCSSSSRAAAADGTPISHLSREAFSKIGAKLSAKRSLYEEFVERSYR